MSRILPSIGKLFSRTLGEMPRASTTERVRSIESFQELSERLIHHIHAHQLLLEIIAHHGLAADTTGEARFLAAESDELAYALAAIPDDEPVLERARNALTTYWKCSWTNSGISESEYTASLRSAAAFLRRQHASQFAASEPVISSLV